MQVTLESIAAEVKALVEKVNAAHDVSAGDVAELKEKLLKLERKAAAGDIAFGEGAANPLAALAKKLTESETIRDVFAGRLTKGGIDVKASDIFETKATITNQSTGVSTPMSAVQRVPGIVVPGAVDVNDAILQAIPRAVATSSSIEWVKMTAAKQLAGSQFASGSPPEREGVAKKQSAFTFALQRVDVVTLAHWTPVSRQALADVSGLAEFLRAELFDGVRREVIRQVLVGDGTDGDMEGFGTAANVSTLPAAVSGEGRIERIRRTIAKLQALGYSPDAIFLNPLDWADIELQKSTGGSEEFLAGVPRGANPAALWNVPVYAHEYQPEGTLTVAALAQSATLWVRQEAQLLVSDSHADLFIKNAVAMLAEARAAFTVARSNAICRGAF